MPIVETEKILFIHIPKCGGTTIEDFFNRNGFRVSFYSTAPGRDFINNHSPQHCTFKELKELDLIKDDWKIFTIVRNPLDRIKSEYSWLIKHRRNKNFQTIDEFLNIFLDKNNKIFDNHNLSCSDFLMNKNNIISPKIKIFNFFDTKSIEKYLDLKDLSNYHSNKSQSEKITFNDNQIKKIMDFYQDDYINLQNFFKNE